jgi:hypothetical protein
MREWNIHRRDERCAGCERVFADGEHHFSALHLAPAGSPEGFAREDRCATCFEGVADRADTLVYWRTEHRARERRGLAIDFDSIERLFLALAGRAEARLAELQYLLALLLLRKKRLKLVRVVRAEGSERLVLRPARRTDELEVAVFDLTPARAEELRRDLERVFDGELAADLGPLSGTEVAAGEGSPPPTA